MQFERFIGIDLGGGKGKNTAVSELRRAPHGLVVAKPEPLVFDNRLIAYLLAEPEKTLVAIDAPLTLPACVRCQLPTCPTALHCDVTPLKWFRERENGTREEGKKPKYTAYTQRACEVLLHEEKQILPRETLGQGMGPLTARATYLRRAIGAAYRLNENLIEVYPKASLWLLFGKRTAEQYRRSGRSRQVRLDILNKLTDLAFAPGNWREDYLNNDHRFDALLCAYTGWLYAEGRCESPREKWLADDGWIWVPNAPSPAP